MLKRTFNFHLPHRCVVYLRMSSEGQNKRSPDQQLAEIKERLKRLGYPWEIVKVYRDNALTGRRKRNRPEYQRMLKDIKLGKVDVSLILVDMLERFGRVDDLTVIRKSLYEKDGVLVLTADTNFADPTTVQGKALGAFEALRATEDGRVKAHNVLRGKKDAARQKHWPGGPVPFGYMLRSVMQQVNGVEEVAHRILIPNPATDWIAKKLFQQAYDSGWGQTLLCRCLNADPNIPAQYKPFQSPTVGYWLDNPIYMGVLRWGKYSTDVIDDARVIERNADEDVLFVADYCEPLIPREIWDKIQTVRNARRRSRGNIGDELATIKPLAPGLNLKYLLTGLVRCGHCRRAMTPSSSTIYTTVAGEEKRYTTYVCPGYLDRICPNSRRIPEAWLREVVISRIRSLLFPPS